MKKNHKKFCCVADMILENGKDLMSVLNVMASLWKRRQAEKKKVH